MRRGQSTTGEPHALQVPADPTDQQAITWRAALEWLPGEHHTLERPAGDEFWRSYRADIWPGPQLGWTTCYRLHPVEWNIGEAAGAVAAYAVRTRQSPRAVRANKRALADLQTSLRAQGFELAWPKVHPV